MFLRRARLLAHLYQALGPDSWRTRSYGVNSLKGEGSGSFLISFTPLSQNMDGFVYCQTDQCSTLKPENEPPARVGFAQMERKTQSIETNVTVNCQFFRCFRAGQASFWSTCYKQNSNIFHAQKDHSASHFALSSSVSLTRGRTVVV